MRVLLTTEGTYPFFRGGVSTWVDALVSGLREHEFVVGAVVGDPHVTTSYTIPPNARILTIPLWGAERVREYLDPPRRSFATRLGHPLSRRPARKRAFDQDLLPAYDEIVSQLLCGGDPRQLGIAFADIAAYCESYDLRSALRESRCWNLIRDRLAQHPEVGEISMADALDVARSLFRYLMPLAATLPPVDVAHSSAAALCALPALTAKIRTGVPLFVTEHGVYVRERVLQLARDGSAPLRKRLLMNLYRAVARCAYSYADAVLPVCSYNGIWERELGVPASRIRTVYNGVDPRRFLPEQVRLSRPTIAFVGRIDPLKDVLGLITAMSIVRRSLPDVRLRIHGPDADADYAARCRSLVAAERLQHNVVFEGPADDAAQAYRESHVVALPSISEGFPYTVIEAMMCGRPVVATTVGGIPEALEDPDLLVEPQNPRALAAKLLAMLRRTPKEREAIADRLRRRATSLFACDSFLDSYRSLYRDGAGFDAA